MDLQRQRPEGAVVPVRVLPRELRGIEIGYQ